ncbi:MAG: nodulation protein NfeD [Desulfuromonadales bacterium]|nr:nodulation protein NfeD [Desulfuromonadales bacterium]
MLRRAYISSLIILMLIGSVLLLSADEVSAPGEIRVVRVAGVINPVLADFISEELSAANVDNTRAFLIELDTPGGLDTSMRAIIQQILGSRIPVIVYVYPSGARAASAGALITLAADFAAMAPGTNIGAAHPVAIGPGGSSGNEQGETMMEKVVNDAVAYARSLADQRGRNRDWAEQIVRESISTPAQEALELKVIDLIAADESVLLKKLHGRTYLRNGQAHKLDTRGVVLSYAEMTWKQEVLNTISNPNVAYMLLMLGMLGIFFEISQPGVILPGAIGALALLLAFLGFQTLPVNYIGALLILLAIILFILEVKVVSYGMLTVGGLIALSFGSLILVDSPEPYLQISRAVIAATVAVCGGFISLVLIFVVRVQKSRFISGLEGMVGEHGQAVTALAPRGRVYVHGEYWDAHSEQPIAEGSEIEIVHAESNLKLLVRAADSNLAASTTKEKEDDPD